MARQTLADYVNRKLGRSSYNEADAPPITGQNPDGTPFTMQTRPGPYRPRGFQQTAALASSTGLTVPSGANLARVQAQAQALRWRDDGTAPTATVGMRIAAGETLEYAGDLAAIRFIQEAAGGLANVSYYEA